MVETERAIFLLTAFPSVEEELSDLNDKLSGGKRQHQNFIEIHSGLQFEYSSLAASRVWGRTAHVADAVFIIR